MDDKKNWKATLFEACEAGDLVVCKRAIRYLKDTPQFAIDNFENGYNCSALGVAANKGRLEIASLLLDEGASPNHQDSRGRTPMHRAIDHNHPEVAQLLLSKGASLDIQDDRGETPLHTAVRSHMREAVRWLAASGSKLDIKCKTGETALQLAISTHQAPSAEFLIDAGAKTSYRDNNNETLLHSACRTGQETLISRLVRAGLDVNAQSGDGRTPLHMACQNGHLECIDLMIQHGARMDIRADGGRLPLHLAAEVGRDDVIKKLIDHGAPVDVHDWGGRRPVHLARQNEHLQAVAMLLKLGSSPQTLADDLLPLIGSNEKISQNMALTLIGHGVKAPSGARAGHLNLEALTAKTAAIHASDTQLLASLFEAEPQAQTPEDEVTNLLGIAKRLKRQEPLAFLTALSSRQTIASIRGKASSPSA